jgi:hypothetical protein
MATKHNTSSKSLKAKKTTRRAAKRESKYIGPHGILMELLGPDNLDKDRAVVAWRKWATIRAQVDLLANPGRRMTTASEKRLERLMSKDWLTGNAVLRAKTSSVSGVAAKLHAALVMTEGSDGLECEIPKILEGMTNLVPGELREKIVPSLAALKRRAAS